MISATFVTVLMVLGAADAIAKPESPELARARATFAARDREWQAASAAVRKRLEANPQWVRARDRFDASNKALVSATKNGPPTALRRARTENAVAGQEFRETDSRLRDADPEYAQSFAALIRAGLDLGNAENRELLTSLRTVVASAVRTAYLGWKN
jgi:hypothetical protein